MVDFKKFFAGIVVFGGLAISAAAQSPFADKPVDSYSAFTLPDGSPGVIKWGDLKADDFGSRTVTFDQSGVRSLRQVPAPGVHPRIYFTPDDLPEVRTRIRNTRCGQEAWKNILCWTEMMKGRYDDKADYAQPDRWKGGFGGLHGRVPLFRLGVPREGGFAYNHHAGAAKIYQSLIDGSATTFPPFYWQVFSLEAFRCLIDNDEAGAKDLARATVTAMRLDQAARDEERKTKKITNPPAEPVGRFQLAYVYDLIYGYLSQDQRVAIHDELAATTWSHDNYGSFNDANGSRSNWATFSYWLIETLAIEDEPGFNDLKIRGMYRGWRNLLTYGWFQSGATYEGEAKNQLGMDGILAFAIRQKRYGFENLTGHPHLRAYADRFVPQSINPMQDGFHKYDLLGGSRSKTGGASPCDFLGLKHMLPDDKVVDWIYRRTVGDDYANVPDRPDGYFNALLFYAIFASDFDPANSDPAALKLGNTFFCGERSLMMTRSGWNIDATMLNLHVRQANGGHPFADRNAIMVAGAGRIWSPNGYASFRARENSLVVIDDKDMAVYGPGRMVEFQDTPLATFAVGDSTYSWNWNWRLLEPKRGYYTVDDARNGRVELAKGWEAEKHTVNDFAFLKLPYDYLNHPMVEAPHWIKPAGAIRPVARTENYPVIKAYRTAGLVRADQPYILVVDDIQKDQSVHHYDWTLALEPDIQIVRTIAREGGELDVILTGGDPDQTQPRAKEPLAAKADDRIEIKPRQPMLLVRVLNRSVDPSKPAGEPTIVELPNGEDAKKYQPVRRLVIPADSVSPDFKVLLVPYRKGDAIPTTQWSLDRNSVELTTGALRDEITFTPGVDGKTNVTISRAGAPVISVDQKFEPLKN